MKRKIIALLLCLCMAAAFLPTAALAEEPGGTTTEGAAESNVTPKIKFGDEYDNTGMPYTIYRTQDGGTCVTLTIELTDSGEAFSFAAEQSGDDWWEINPANFIVKYGETFLTAWNDYVVSAVVEYNGETCALNKKAVNLMLLGLTSSGTLTVQAKSAAFEQGNGRTVENSIEASQEITLPALPTDVQFGELEEGTGIPTSVTWKQTEESTPILNTWVRIQKYPVEINSIQSARIDGVKDGDGTYTAAITGDAHDWFTTAGNLRDGEYCVTISYSAGSANESTNHSPYLTADYIVHLQSPGKQGDALAYRDHSLSHPAGSDLNINVQTLNCAFNKTAAENPENWTVTFDGQKVTPQIKVHQQDNNEQASLSIHIPVTTAEGKKSMTIVPNAAVFDETVETSQINSFNGEVYVTAFASPTLKLETCEDVNIKAGQAYVKVRVYSEDIKFDVDGAKNTANWTITGASGLTLQSVEDVGEVNAALVFTGNAVGGKALTIAAKSEAFGVSSGASSTSVSVPIDNKAFTPNICGYLYCNIGDEQGQIVVESTNIQFGNGVTDTANWDFAAGATGLAVDRIEHAYTETEAIVPGIVLIRLKATGGARGGELSITAKAGAFEGAAGSNPSNAVTLIVDKAVACPKDITYTSGANGKPAALTWTWTKSDDTIFPVLRSVSQWAVNSDDSTQQKYCENINTGRLTITPAPDDPQANGTYTYTYTLDPNNWKPNQLAKGTYFLTVDFASGNREYHENGPRWTVGDGNPNNSNNPTFPGDTDDGSSSGSDSTSSNTTTTTEKNPDGSQTKVEIKKDGTVTTTETDKAGNMTETVEKPDGSIVTKVAQKDGTTATVTTDTKGKVEAEVKLPAKVVADAQEKGEAVTLPIPEVKATKSTDTAPVVTVKTGSKDAVKVEIPTTDITPGTVAVIVKADGTEEVIKTSIPTENGVEVSLPDGATVKIVDNSKTFTDVPASSWAANAVNFSSARELFSGTSENTFTPEAPMTRAMMMTVLARFDGADTTGGSTWYEKGREWATANNISDGSDPNGNITREQLAVMLWRYAGSPAAANKALHFTDADKASNWALEALRWAAEIGVLNGKGSGILDPTGQATRAETAQMLKNFMENH